MFFAVIAMLIGSGISAWAIHEHNQSIAIAGLIIIMTVCVSWWLWVMFIINTMISLHDSTIGGVVEIQSEIKVVKVLLQEYESTRQR